MIPELNIWAALLAAFLFILILCIGWRVICQYKSIPWPWWLAWMLEKPNPYMMLISPSSGFINFVAAKPGMNIADFGVGGGRIAIPLAKISGKNGSVDCFDMQKKMLELTKNRAQKEKLVNLNYFHRTFPAEKTDTSFFQKQRYDRIIALTVIGEIPNYENFLAEASKGLKPGGRLIISEVLPDPCYVAFRTLVKKAEASGLALADFKKGPLSYIASFKRQQD